MKRPPYRRRGIYLLPTAFTVGNLFCGFYSLIESSIGGLEVAAMLIVIAAMLDGLDGRIARLTGTTSDFGLEFDSLADIVSFGLAPALLAFHWALRPTGRIGWLIAFLYVVCAAMRLARYNTQNPATIDRRWFVGLPSPMAGCVIACFALAWPDPSAESWQALVLTPAVLAIAGLMISRLRYRSFREIDLRNRRSYFYVLPVAAFLVSVVLYPKAVVLLFCSAYLLSAPTLYVWTLISRRQTAETGPAAPTAEVADEPAFQ